MHQNLKSKYEHLEKLSALETALDGFMAMLEPLVEGKPLGGLHQDAINTLNARFKKYHLELRGTYREEDDDFRR